MYLGVFTNKLKWGTLHTLNYTCTAIHDERRWGKNGGHNNKKMMPFRLPQHEWLYKCTLHYRNSLNNKKDIDHVNFLRIIYILYFKYLFHSTL